MSAIVAGSNHTNAPRRRGVWRRAIALALVFGSTSAAPSSGRTTTITPDMDWCAAANSLAPGDELLLAPGDYTSPCTLRRGGRPGAPIIIRAADAEARPRLVSTTSLDNVVNIEASVLTLRGLRFGPTSADVDAIRVKSGDDITVENCVFVDVAGIAVVANATSRRLAVRDNEILDSKATAIYLGCHDGFNCRVTDAVVANNYISRVDAPPEEIGYGIQVKLNSTAAIHDNVIVDTKGPGIMVYGSHETTSTSVLERNFVAQSRQSSDIVIGGGPAIIQNNIVVGAAEAGIALEDYSGRRLLRRITIMHNTVYGARGGGITFALTTRPDVKILYNAIHSAFGVSLPPVPSGLQALGNVNCAVTPCFVDPSALNFTPLPGSQLIARAPNGYGTPRDDFFGVPRAPVTTVGAVEAGSGGPIRLGRRARCSDSIC